MELQVLGSGSKGNCYALSNGVETLLLEAGMPLSQILNKVNLQKVNNCLISHEHKDHSKSVYDLIKYGVNLYSSNGTFEALNCSNSHRIKYLQNKKEVSLGTFNVLPFDIVHDAKEPLGFIICDTISKEKVLFATDTWYLKYKFPAINYWLIECNYCKYILDEHIENKLIAKNTLDRIRTSHMSLEMLEETLIANDLSKVYKIVLLHLSDSRSDEKEMIRRIKEVTGKETVSAHTKPFIRLTKTWW